MHPKGPGDCLKCGRGPAQATGSQKVAMGKKIPTEEKERVRLKKISKQIVSSMPRKSRARGRRRTRPKSCQMWSTVLLYLHMSDIRFPAKI